MPVTAFGNDKGGPGKTAVAALVAAALAQKGRKVLAGDLDPQGNLTRRMGYSEEEIKPRITMAEVVRDESADTARKAFIPCQWDEPWSDNITLIPARSTLVQRVAEAGNPGSFLRLRRALRPLLAEFDDILIDTPPGLGHMMHLALAAADGVVLVTEPGMDSMRGAIRLQHELVEDERMRENLSLDCNVVGVVINRLRSPKVSDEEEHCKRAEARWGDLLLKPYITLRAPISGGIDRAEPPMAMDNGDVRDLVTTAGTAYAERIIAGVAA